MTNLAFHVARFGLCALFFLGLGCVRAGDAAKPGDVAANSVGMKLAYVPAGEFDMGSPGDEKGREDDEALHRVKLTRPFRIGVTEVTQAQWKAVMGSRRGEFDGDALPVESVSWKDAAAFCEKLSKSEGKTYRLPTEAEWEYACRAGSAGRFSGAGTLADAAWNDDNAEEKTHAVATKKPNAWGLYDMHGNVAEWCRDCYAPKFPTGRPDTPVGPERDKSVPPAVTDPAGPAEGTGRVVRGGSWSSFERGCRCASRSSINQAHQMKTIGFRVVMELP